MDDDTELARRVLSVVLEVMRAELIADDHHKTGQLDRCLSEITAADGVATATVPGGYEWLHRSVYVDLERDEYSEVVDRELDVVGDETVEAIWDSIASRFVGNPAVDVGGSGFSV